MRISHSSMGHTPNLTSHLYRKSGQEVLPEPLLNQARESACHIGFSVHTKAKILQNLAIGNRALKRESFTASRLNGLCSCASSFSVTREHIPMSETLGTTSVYSILCISTQKSTEPRTERW